MSTITIDLTKKHYSKTGPQFKAIRANLQGNILKSHGRDHAAHIFFYCDTTRVAESRAYLREFAKNVTSAYMADLQSANKKNDPTSFFYGLYLSADGYRDLNLTGAMPPDPQFQKGMKDQTVQDRLADNVETWEDEYKNNFHGVMLIAQDSTTKKLTNGQTPRPKSLETTTAKVVAALNQIGTTTFVQYGNQVFNTLDKGPGRGQKLDAVENFGYVDGISQPKFFKEDVPDPNAVSQWDPTMPWNLVLVPDPGTNVSNCLGSYFVFRKLEQNVAAFKASEEALGETLLAEYLQNRPTPPLSEEEADRIKELAGALVVGRWENGMPVKVSDDPGFIRADHPHNKPGIPVNRELVGHINNFNYDNDNLAAKCPFHAHIRKTNPRGESPGFLSEIGVVTTVEEERGRMMARRGITYGTRTDDPNAELEPSARPTKDVGLLFMSFQRDINTQFEFIQNTWANNDNFVKGGTGKDPVIGQGGTGDSMADGNYEYAAVYNDPATKFKPEPHPFERFVTMKGGEYFFAPSISFLMNL